MVGMKAILGRSRFQLLGALLALMALPASATPAPGPDYSAMVEGAKTELSSALTTIGPIVFGILGILAAVAFAWKMFKRAAKSS